jgi:hypothetical protein
MRIRDSRDNSIGQGEPEGNLMRFTSIRGEIQYDAQPPALQPILETQGGAV